MSEEELLKYMTITDDKIIFDRVFYENTVMNCIDNAIKIKHILTEFEKWLEEDFKNEMEHPTPQIYCNCYSCKIKALDKLQELKNKKID